MASSRAVKCPDCGATRHVRQDSKAQLCQSCSGRRARAAGGGRRTTGRSVPCELCGSMVWATPAVPRRYCSARCHDAARAKNARTVRECATCGKPFRYIVKPYSNCSGTYCSRACRDVGYTTGVTVRWVSTQAAKQAGGKLNYAVKMGRVSRGRACEECGLSGVAIEGAHWDYSRPLDVRWLCRRCHRLWDHASPKGGAVRVRLAPAAEVA